MSETAIKMEGVSKYYKLYGSPKDRLKEALHPFGRSYHKKFFALNDINLNIRKGEIVGVIGSNGSGKSTLLKLIANVLMPNSGKVEVNGTISALLELGAGFNPDFSGIENLYFYATILGLPKEAIDEKLDDILAFADIGEFINQPLKTYSNGMKARLGFAIATEIDPDILIIDEVLAVGDAAFQRKCYARIENFLNKGKTVLLVSHNRSSIVSLCDSAILLDRGTIKEQGRSDEVVKFYEVLINERFKKSSGKEIATGAHMGAENDTGDKTGSGLSCDEENYDNSLLAEPVYFQSSKVEFDEFLILNQNDKATNVLMPGSQYSVLARFSFHEDLENLFFAFRIKTQQGIMVSWAAYPFVRREYLSAREGERLTIRFKFSCNLLDGVYSVDAGLHSTKNDDITVHVGYHDMLLFKVNKTKNNTHGISHLNLKDAEAIKRPIRSETH